MPLPKPIIKDYSAIKSPVSSRIKIIAVICALVIIAALLQTTRVPEEKQIVSNPQPLVDPCDGKALDNSHYCDKSGEITDLTTVDPLVFYDHFMNSMPIPSRAKRTFANALSGVKLEVVLIETSQAPSPRLLSTIYNIGHVYGGTNVSFTIIAHAYHRHTVADYLSKGEWTNVRVILIGDHIFKIREYNLMLTSTWFWNIFDSQFVLIGHTDSLFIRPVDGWMYQFDLLGAPWVTVPGGNGGYTLRRVDRMRKIVAGDSYVNDNSFENEDLWMCSKVGPEGYPPKDRGIEFSVETVPMQSVTPTGAHKLFAYPESFVVCGDCFKQLARHF